MAKTKQTLITLDDTEKAKARELSRVILGRYNVSGLVAYLINEKAKQVIPNFRLKEKQ